MSADNTGELANIRVLVEIDGPVATLTLNRPDKRNAINMAMWASIEAHVSALTANRDIRVLVVRGECDHFCAGADISELTTIATACDIRISADDALFGITPAKLGIVYPTNALERAVRVIGGSAAKHLMFTGELIQSERALRIGLVDEVHSVTALNNRVDELVALLVERSALTQVATKAMIDEVVREGKVKPKTTLYWETEMDKSGEVREGVAAFLAKRPVRWPWKRS